MDDQRLSVYAELINKLLKCPRGEENTILNNHPELLDEGLLAAMQHYSDILRQQGTTDAAASLQNLGQQIEEFIRQGDSPQEAPSAERQQAYMNLIQRLLACQVGEEQRILGSPSDFLDQGFVHMCEQVALGLVEQHSLQAAARLRSYATQLADIPRKANPSNSKEQEVFFLQLLQTVQWSNGSMANVHTLLSYNLPLLNTGLVALLGNFSAHVFEQVDQGKRENLAAVLGTLGNIMQEYPLGNPQFNQLIAIEAYTNTLRVYTEAELPQAWAITNNNLGNAYSKLVPFSENPKQQIEKAIECYANALRVRTDSELPQDYAMTNNNLGAAYSKLAPFSENPKQQMETAIEAYSNALRFYTEAELPQAWATTNFNLGIAYSKLAPFSENPKQQIENAIEAYTNALRVRTEFKLPQAWATTTNNLGNAYIKLAPFSENPKQQVEKAIEAHINALRVRTENEQPQDWADTNIDLGNAYIKLAPFSENPKEQVEKAIEAYINALRCCSEVKLPKDYALTNNNLGAAYSKLAPFSENPKQQIEKAIEAYISALRFYTEAVLPHAWAATSNNLGIAYGDLAPLSENPKQQIEKAIEAYTNALRVYTEAELPQAWAITTNNLGTTYGDLAPFSENPKQQIENAIDAYTNALRVRTEAELPQDWAATNNNLGNAYRNLAPFSENPKQQIENAIDAYTNALRVRTEAELPQDWAATNNNLGNAYCALAPFSENPKKQIEHAIMVYTNALRARTEAELPQDWATTTNNLGNAYGALAPFSENPKQQIENAIEAYTNALRVRTEAELPQAWASTINNLGTAYNALAPFSENQKQQIDKAIEAYTSALRVYTEVEQPQDWADTNNNLGAAYSELAPFSESPKQQIENAIEAYTNALRIRDSVTQSADCLKTARNLGNLGFKNNLRDVAIKGYALAIAAVENLRSVAIDPARKAMIVAEAIEVYANLVQVYVDAQLYDEALEVADRSKARNLVELLATKDLYPKGDIPPDVIRRLDALRGSIARAERQLNKTHTAQDPTADGGSIARGDTHTLNLGPPNQQAYQLATDRLLREKQQLEHLIQFDIQPIDPTFSLSQKVQPLTFEQLQAALPDGRTALVSWYVAGDRLVAFLVSSQASQPTCHVYPEDTLENLIQALNRYIQTYLQEKEEWARSLPKALMEFAGMLEVDSLARKISEMAPDADQLILVPHRFLHLLPLHCLSLSESNDTLLDHFARGVRFAPSLQVLQLVQQRPQTGLDSLFAIENPTRDLPYTDLEVEAIHPLFGSEHTVLRQQAATKAALERSSSTLASSTCLHFSCHGTFNFAQPQLSALILADSHVESQPDDADPDRYLPQLDGSALDLTRCLTLLDLFQLDLRQARLVTLSACETGLSEINSLSDEFVGLSSGFLYAGCNSVIGTLWTVSDISTGLLMAEFYRLLKQQEHTQSHTDVAVALKQAQHWLRQLTCEQAVARIEHALPSLPEAVRPNYTYDIQELKRRHQPTDCLYSSPFHWAAFCAVGQ
jgi:CHAT domain-containing protein/Lon protease-like protein